MLLLTVGAFVLGGQTTAQTPAAAPTVERPSDTSADAGFARDMQTHHAQAVEMAMLAYRKSTSEHLRVLGYDIAPTQQAQIGTMSAWLAQWHLLPTGTRPAMAWMPAMSGNQAMSSTDGLMPGMATPDEMAHLRVATGRDFDVLFCRLMIRHHLGGITMIDGLLQAGHRTEVKALAESMKMGQQMEITAFTEILDTIGAAP
jgi:uncharacterized protein (DUF305 family)